MKRLSIRILLFCVAAAVLAACFPYNETGLQTFRKIIFRYPHSYAAREVFPSKSSRNMGNDSLSHNLASWVGYLRDLSPTSEVETRRVGCREYETGAQSCVFEGVICVDVGAEAAERVTPRIFLVDDTRRDNEVVPSDSWCDYRHQSSDPRYYGARHWPIMEGTVAPQWSCMDAMYRRSRSLLHISAEPTRYKQDIQWVDSLWLVNLDYVNNPHNNHLLSDIVWMLDVVLWQQSLDSQPSPAQPHYPNSTGFSSAENMFTSGAEHVFLPQSREDFIQQTRPDINRLIYALVLQLDLSRLYPGVPVDALHSPTYNSHPIDNAHNTSRGGGSAPLHEPTRQTAQLLDAYPELLHGPRRALFYADAVRDSGTSLVCTRRLAAGAKLGQTGHERVCRSLRERSWRLFGVNPPEMVRVGQILYARPPRRVVVLQRHVRRRIGNAMEVERALRREFELPYGVQVEMRSTGELKTAEEHVRFFARVGVLITPHGSQSMGQIWMPRHSTLVEVMPLGYTDMAFNILSDSCKVWYRELQSMRSPRLSDDFYVKHCGSLTPHLLNPCVAVKNQDVWINTQDLIDVVRDALERMGHALDPWLENVNGTA